MTPSDRIRREEIASQDMTVTEMLDKALSDTNTITEDDELEETTSPKKISSDPRIRASQEELDSLEAALADERSKFNSELERNRLLRARFEKLRVKKIAS